MIRQILALKKYNKDFKLKHPDYFPYDGITVFCGVQGSGKTLSAVKYVRDLLLQYPKCICISNVIINDDNICDRVFEWQGEKSLHYENGEYGIIYLIDEMHVEFNALNSKDISTDVFIEISQQRKQRKMIVGTSQLFLRMAKPFREQCKQVVFCSPCFFGFKISNEWCDGATLSEVNGEILVENGKLTSFYKSEELYNLYDTYAKIRKYKNSYDMYNLSDLKLIKRKKR